MKVYVSELPKDCIECPFCQDIKVNAGMDRLLFCKANKGKAIKNIEKSFDKCIVKNEFQSLADYTKQVRKEVVQEIKDLSGDYLENENQQLKQQLAETEESYNNTMRYLNKIRSILLNLQNTKEKQNENKI